MIREWIRQVWLGHPPAFSFNWGRDHSHRARVCVKHKKVKIEEK
jgi:hypothetical protein